jgi:hypothetical protein
VVVDGRLEQEDRLLGRVVELLLVRSGHDHLGRPCPPDGGLVALAEEWGLGAYFADDPAGLVLPVIPGSAHGEQRLLPDDLGYVLEADPRETRGDLRDVGAGVPDVADGEIRGYRGPLLRCGARERRWLSTT